MCMGVVAWASNNLPTPRRSSRFGFGSVGNEMAQAMRQAEEWQETMNQQVTAIQHTTFNDTLHQDAHGDASSIEDEIAQAMREAQEELIHTMEKAQSGVNIASTLAVQQGSPEQNDGTEVAAEQKSLS